MGEFKDASVWIQVAFLTIAIGFLVLLFGFAEGLGGSFGSGGSEACLVIGFLCFLTALMLAVCLVFLDQLKGNKIALICYIVFSLIAGIATIIGLAIWGTDHGDSDPPTFSTMHGVLGGLLAILSGVFAILDIAGVKSG